MLYDTGNPKLVPCAHLGGWDGREVREMLKNKGTHVYLLLVHGDVWHKPTQHCEIVILQLNTNEKKFNYADEVRE